MTHNLKNSDFDEDQKPEVSALNSLPSFSCVITQKTSLLMTHGDPNLENIDFDAFYDMALSEDDEARELAFLLAHVPPRNVTPPHNVTRAFSSTPAVSASTTAISLQIRIQTPPSSPTPARQRSGPSDLVPPPYLSPELPQVPSTPNRSPVVKTHHSPAPPRLILSDEAAFWVVTSGAHPGIYHGRYVNILCFLNPANLHF